jgi:hypothetical protein
MSLFFGRIARLPLSRENLDPPGILIRSTFEKVVLRMLRLHGIQGQASWVNSLRLVIFGVLCRVGLATDFSLVSKA